MIKMAMPVESKDLHVPDLQEISSVLKAGLDKNFKESEVSVVDCPDLTQAPFSLASPGLCGSPVVADVGGVPNLMPSVNRKKLYDVKAVAEAVGLTDGLLVGAGAGPHHILGINSEMMCNYSHKSDGPCCNRTTIAKVVDKDTALQEATPNGTTEFALMANLFISQGNPGKVLEVKASHRTGEQNFMVCLRETLKNHYGDQPVALGGAFLIESGSAWIHVMPDFSSTPLTTAAQQDAWLKYYDYKAPLVALGYLISHDPGLSLRMEHFHAFSDHAEGGHYHYDTTPDTVSYRAYFNIPHKIYRIDRPAE